MWKSGDTSALLSAGEKDGAQARVYDGASLVTESGVGRLAECTG